MSNRSDKKNIFNQIKVFSSLKEQTPLDTQASLASLKTDNKDVLTFLLDLISILIGFNGIKDLAGRFLKRELPKLEPKIKDIFKAELVSAVSDEIIPQEYIGIGVFIPAFILDRYGDLKSDYNTNSTEGLINNILPASFDQVLYNALKSPGTPQVYLSLLRLVYNDQLSIVTIRIHESYNGKTIQKFINDYIDSLFIVNATKIIAEILDLFFNLLGKQFNKSKSNIEQKIRDNKLLLNIFEEKEKYFVYNGEQEKEIKTQIENSINGYNLIDFGCGFNQTTLDYPTFISKIELIQNTPSEREASNILEGMIEENNGLTRDANDTNIKNNFFRSLFQNLAIVLIKNTLLSPSVILIFILVFLFRKKPVLIDSNNEIVNELQVNPTFLTASLLIAFQGTKFITENINLLKCIIEKIKKIFLAVIGDIVKKEILKIVLPAITKLAQEKLSNFETALKSLVKK